MTSLECEQLDMCLLKSVENEIIIKCRQEPGLSTNLAKLLLNKQQQRAFSGIYLMAVINLCSQGKVRLQQELLNKKKQANTPEAITITLIN